jgi:16S rRNA (uracil1498-N3)-methyltransferase
MSDRFFSDTPIAGDHATLDGPEAHHLLHVMRAAAGDRVTLFDNSGAEFDAQIEKLGRASVELNIVERREIDRELPFTLEVGVALPKGDRQKWLVEKLTELGVATLVPLATTRGVAQPTDSALERLHRAAIEAAKQCGRNRLMQIKTPQSWNDWLSQPPPPIAGGPRPPNCHRLLAHPNGIPLADLPISALHPTQLAIGPEGGFTDAEIAAAADAGWQTVSLGPRILRVETAAIALAATIILRAK